MLGNAKSAYVDNSVATASPARLLVMLYDRLVSDLRRAVEAQRIGDHQESHHQLVHAQEIVIHLRSTLQVEVWDGGPGLASLYDWLHAELIKANVRKDVHLTQSCLSVVVDLADTWRQAAMASVLPAS